MISSLENFPEKIKERDNCIIPLNLWQKWWKDLDNKVLLVEIKQNNTIHVFTIDTYHNCSNIIYIPSNFAKEYTLNEMVEVKLLNTIPPIATSVTVNVLTSNYKKDLNLAESLSNYLSDWNVLTCGAILSIPCRQDRIIDVIVTDIQPEKIALLRGDVCLKIEKN
jgi:hypothetical protein